MAHLITSDDKYPDFSHNASYRSYLISRTGPPPDYQFGRTQGKRFRIHARSALRHVNGYFRTIIEAIANAKLKRLERELQLRGIRYDCLDNDPAVCKRASGSVPAGIEGRNSLPASENDPS